MTRTMVDLSFNSQKKIFNSVTIGVGKRRMCAESAFFTAVVFVRVVASDEVLLSHEGSNRSGSMCRRRSGLVVAA